MAIKREVLTVFCLLCMWEPCSVFCATREPFRMGFCMAGNGAIVERDGVTGRDPFTSASFYGDTFSYGLCVAGVEYFDGMDNMSALHIAQAGLGGFYSKNGFSLKAAFSHFDALRVYYEQNGFLSLGYDRLPLLKASLELCGGRAGVFSNDNIAPQTRLESGVSAVVPFSIGSVTCVVSHIPLKQAHSEGYYSPLSIAVGAHSVKNSLGAQGFVVEIQNDYGWQFRAIIAEEYRLAKNCGVSLSISTNPVLINFGFVYEMGQSAIAAAFSDHAVLGWSKGLALCFAGK